MATEPDKDLLEHPDRLDLSDDEITPDDQLPQPSDDDEQDEKGDDQE